MWEHLAWKVSVAYEQVPPDEETIRLIYGLASACSRRSLPEGADYLSSEVERFFTNILNSTDEAAADAGTRIINPDFVFSMDKLAYLSADQVAAMKQRFYAAQHGTRMDKAREPKHPADSKKRKR